jgi:hypothetical protein
MKRKDRIQVELSADDLWTLSKDRKAVRMAIPPLPVAGLSEPLQVYVAFDAGMVDETLTRLAMLRREMRPPSQRR